MQEVKRELAQGSLAAVAQGGETYKDIGHPANIIYAPLNNYLRDVAGRSAEISAGDLASRIRGPHMFMRSSQQVIHEVQIASCGSAPPAAPTILASIGPPSFLHPSPIQLADGLSK